MSTWTDTASLPLPGFPGVVTLERELDRLRTRLAELNNESAGLREEIDSVKQAIDVLREWKPPL